MQLEDSPLDAAVFGVPEAVAIGVLIRRGRRTRTFILAKFANPNLLLLLLHLRPIPGRLIDYLNS